MCKKEILKNYIEQISSLDKEIIYLLYRRLEIVKQISKIEDSEKATVILNDLLDDNLYRGGEFWLRDEFIIDLFDKIDKERLS